MYINFHNYIFFLHLDPPDSGQESSSSHSTPLNGTLRECQAKGYHIVLLMPLPSHLDSEDSGPDCETAIPAIANPHSTSPQHSVETSGVECE